MTHEEASQLLARFERDHAVESYTVAGVHVWPLIRMFIGIRLVMGGGRVGGATIAARAGTRARGIALRVFRVLRNGYRALAAKLPPGLRRENRWPERGRGFPSAIFTVADRAHPWDDAWIHNVADPLADLLKEHGLETRIWELGRSAGPRRHDPHSIVELHKHRYNVVSSRYPITLPRPAWFEEIDTFLARDCGFRIAWHEFEATIRHVLVLSEVIGAWMESAGCRLLFLDCWFTSHSMAASLAASRRGIPSVDFQHGVHGEGNVGYNRWVKAPDGGYAIMPRYYWVWGEDEADALGQDNHPGVVAAERVLAGGNLWINRWRRGGDARMREAGANAGKLREGFSRTVLVTLQTPVVAYPGWLLDAIRASPRDWRWLIRIHRRDAAEQGRIEREFLQTGHPGVEAAQASALPLYALLQQADVHVTGYSTCALEALAFGLRSMLTHPSADSVYRGYIMRGVMKRCESAGELLEQIREGAEASGAAMRSASERAFAPEEAASAAMEILLRELKG